MFKFNKLNKHLFLITLSAILFACLIPGVFAQSVSKKSSSQNFAPPASKKSNPQDKVQLQIVNDKPWLVTVVHQINLSEIEKALQQRGIKMNISGDRLINFVPVNVTTGIVIDKQGHILTRLVNLNPEAGEKGIGNITIMLPSGEERQARFVGLDGPSGFCLLMVENLNIEPARLANQVSLDFNAPVTLLNVEFGDKPNTKQNLDRLDRLRQFSRKLLSQTSKVVQFANIGFFSISFSNTFSKDSSLSFGVVLNQNKEIIGIPENFQNNAMKVFSASEAHRAATRVIDRQGNVPRAWLGISGSDVSKLTEDKILELKLTRHNGVYVNNVIPNSPAEVFGLRENDVILTLNNEFLESETQLSSFIALQPAGEALDIGVWRSSQLYNYRVVLGARGYNSPFVLDKTEEQAQIYSMEQELKSVENSLYNFRKEFSKLNNQLNNQPPENNSVENSSVENNSVENSSLENTIDNIKALEIKRKKILLKLKGFPYNLGDFNSVENFLGVKVEDLPEPPPNPDPTKPQKFPHGVKVIEILPNSLAERTGVKVGDVLVQIATLAIDNKDSLNVILPLVKRSAALAQNTLIVTRDSQRLVLEMPLPRKLPKITFTDDGYILTEDMRKKLEDEKFNFQYSNTAEEDKPQNK
ncbi:MAG: PDZ domain-containing protein [Acidobacteria bacterium]|nr:PDZ domain-containing protein [Acidobacteriota bacterium]